MIGRDFFIHQWRLVAVLSIALSAFSNCITEKRMPGRFGYMGKDFEVATPSPNRRSAKLCIGGPYGYDLSDPDSFSLVPSVEWIFGTMAPESGVITDVTIFTFHNCIMVSGEAGEITK